jgi:hypothetical protein
MIILRFPLAFILAEGGKELQSMSRSIYLFLAHARAFKASTKHHAVPQHPASSRREGVTTIRSGSPHQGRERLWRITCSEEWVRLIYSLL